jgi:3-isopropylmalate dehydratase small subunit
LTGRVWKFGDDVNTDLIIPGKYLDSYDFTHLAAHAMEGASKEFAGRVAKGDIIVAGANFGCGSSREQAVVALKHAGVAVVVAKSFARIFYRNSINLGLPVLVSQDAFGVLEDGDEAVMDGQTLSSRDGKKKAHLEPVPDHLRKILEQGGLVPFIKTRLKLEKT